MKEQPITPAARSAVDSRPSFAPGYLPPLYQDVYQFFAAHSITVPASEDWRLTDRLVGHINALTESHGFLVATNGILCYIEREDGSLYGPGHIAWFLTNKNERVEVDKETKKIRVAAQPRESKLKAMVLDLI
jgi:hypothetical protein